MRSNKPFCAAKSIFVIFITLLLASVIVPAQTQQATKFKVLHTFHGNDGVGPIGQLVRDTAGNLYGVAAIGGMGKCQSDGQRIGCGTAFKMNKSGKMVWVHSFNGSNGNEPQAGLLRDTTGNLYGTTVDGGKTNNHICSTGCGLVFKLDKAGQKETVLHKFTGTPDGYSPASLLADDSAGNLYGVTDIGGTGGVGTLFKIDTAGHESILYNFTGGSDGCFPEDGVVLDSVGNLYGVASQGGDSFCNSGLGVVFEIDTSGNETVLHTFAGGDGAYPDSVLLFDSQGNLYGTTEGGGSGSACNYEGGCGTIFELSPQGDGTWSETVLYDFCSFSGCIDGLTPGGDLVRDKAGNFYGTADGGTNRNCNRQGCGVAFRLDTTGKETVLHSFTGGSDGAFPWLNAMDATGNLYGAALQGGDANCHINGIPGCGVVFKITP
jgi:uncharacterized repeat protein (TIGR03803 family)